MTIKHCMDLISEIAEEAADNGNSMDEGSWLSEKLKEIELAIKDMVDTDRLERWEAYRLEMENFEHRMAGTAKNFLELGAYKSASECAIQAEAAQFICGRMPAKTDGK